MKRLIVWIFLLLPVFGFASIPLIRDFDRAAKLTKEYDIPLVLLFTGSKLDEDSQSISKFFEDKAFEETIKSSALFMEVDFLDREEKNSKRRDQNRNLRKEFNVKAFPTWVLLDSSLREITRMGAIELNNPKKFAAILKGHLFDYLSLQAVVEKRGLETCSIEKLQELYETASSLNCLHFTKMVLEEGLRKDQGTFFPLEKYIDYFNKGESEEEKGVILKNELLKRDPENKTGVRLRLALLDVQAHPDDPKEAVKRLTDYVETYGDTDQDNLSRLHLVISEFFSRMGEDDNTISKEPLDTKTLDCIVD